MERLERRPEFENEGVSQCGVDVKRPMSEAATRGLDDFEIGGIRDYWSSKHSRATPSRGSRMLLFSDHGIIMALTLILPDCIRSS